MKIGVLGGTFDPIHQGHLALARSARDHLGLDKVIFIPAFIPPHKNVPQTPALCRYRMVEMAIADEPSFEISDLEFTRPDISYTADTLKQLKSWFENAEFYLLMGADSFNGFASWKNPDEILRLSRLAVASRPETFASALSKAERIPMEELSVSSTEIRRRLARGEDLGAELICPKVMGYIKEMKLYGTSV